MCKDREKALELCKKYNLIDLYDYIYENYSQEEKIFIYIKDHQSEKIVQAIIFSKNNCWKYEYCLYIEDRQEIWATITDDKWKYYYCLRVSDRRELWSTITEDKWKYWYCRYIKDRQELSSTITDDCWKNEYLKWKKEQVNV